MALTSKLPPLPILERVGLTDEESKRNVLKLSGGQQQRVAIARALASDAKVILADEPTGNLDEDTAADITAILKECAHQMNKCVVIVTHSNELARPVSYTHLDVYKRQTQRSRTLSVSLRLMICTITLCLLTSLLCLICSMEQREKQAFSMGIFM